MVNFIRLTFFHKVCVTFFNDFQREQQQRAKRDRSARQQAYQRAKTAQNHTKQKQQSQQKEADAQWNQWNAQKSKKEPSPENLSPLSREYFEHYRADFESVNWVYSPQEEVYASQSNKFAILGVSTTSTLQERKIAYRTLSKKYRPFINFNNPSTVSTRASEIIKVINNAKIDLIDQLKGTSEN